MGSEQMFVDKRRGMLTGDAVTFRPDPAVVLRVGNKEVPIPDAYVDWNRGIVNIPSHILQQFRMERFAVSMNNLVSGMITATASGHTNPRHQRKQDEREKELKKKPAQNYLKLNGKRF